MVLPVRLEKEIYDNSRSVPNPRTSPSRTTGYSRLDEDLHLPGRLIYPKMESLIANAEEKEVIKEQVGD
jgi:hypothetical protein